MSRSICILLTAFVATLNAGDSAWAQLAPPPSQTPATQGGPAYGHRPRERKLYAARFLPATDLAKTLSVLFQNEDRGGQTAVVAEPLSNQLLISGEPAAVAETLKLIETLDRQPKTVAVDIWIMEVEKVEKAPSLQFSGPLDKIMPQIRELEKAGALTIANHIQLGGLENQPAMVQQGERRAMVRGSQANVGGTRSSSATVENLGTLATATARVSPGGEIAIELSVEKSYLAPLEEAPTLSSDPKGGEVKAQGSLVMTCRTTVALPDGHAITLSGITRNATSPEVRVLVSARTIGEQRTNAGP